jgi:hypothetical protein
MQKNAVILSGEKGLRLTYTALMATSLQVNFSATYPPAYFTLHPYERVYACATGLPAIAALSASLT